MYIYDFRKTWQKIQIQIQTQTQKDSKARDFPHANLSSKANLSNSTNPQANLQQIFSKSQTHSCKSIQLNKSPSKSPTNLQIPNKSENHTMLGGEEMDIRKAIKEVSSTKEGVRSVSWSIYWRSIGCPPLSSSTFFPKVPATTASVQ